MEVIPFEGHLVFSDYERPALRLAAIQKIRVIHEFTHIRSSLEKMVQLISLLNMQWLLEVFLILIYLDLRAKRDCRLFKLH